MTIDRGSMPRSRAARAAVTLVELAVSVAVVGVMMVASLTTLSTVSMGRQVDNDKQLARTLGELLMAEILAKSYQDPAVHSMSFGLEDGEPPEGPRSLFDDVDDYDGWSPAAMEWVDGVPIPGRDGWQRSVEVICVSPTDLGTKLPQGWDFGIKRITVTVTCSGRELATLVALRGRTEDLR